MNRFKQEIVVKVFMLFIGACASVVMVAILTHELNYDRFHIKSNRIYSLVSNLETQTGTITSPLTCGELVPKLSHCRAVQETVRINRCQFSLRAIKSAFIVLEGVVADPSLFKVFNLQFIKGNPETALNQPLSVVLTEEMSALFFGSKEPLGQTLYSKSPNRTLKVTGVIRKLPGNSQIKANLLVSMSTFSQISNPEPDKHCSNPGLITYVLLKPGANKNQAQEDITALLKTDWNDMTKGTDGSYQLILKPLNDGVLSPLRSPYTAIALYILSFISLIILMRSIIYLTKFVFAGLHKLGQNGKLPFEKLPLLMWRVGVFCLVAMAPLILFSAGGLYKFANLPNILIGASEFETAVFEVLTFILIFALLTCIRVAVLPPLEPVKAYFATKKGYGKR